MYRKLAATTIGWLIGAFLAGPALTGVAPNSPGGQATAANPRALAVRHPQPERPSGRVNLSSAPAGDAFTSTDNQGDLYYVGPGLDGTPASDIYFAKRTPSGYKKARRLGSAINTPGREYAPFIASDGSYLVFARHDPSLGVDSFFLSFRTESGHWTEAIYLREYVPTTGHCLSASVTPDGGQFVYSEATDLGRQNKVVDAGFIDELRQQVFGRREHGNRQVV